MYSWVAERIVVDISGKKNAKKEKQIEMLILYWQVIIFQVGSNSILIDPFQHSLVIDNNEI